jgi:two-component system response regulator YesN
MGVYIVKLDPAQAAFCYLLLSGTLVHEGTFSDMQRKYRIDVRPQLVMLVSIDRYPELAFGKPLTWKIEIGRNLVDAVHEALHVPFVWVWIEEGVLSVLLELPNEERFRKNIRERIFQMARRIQKSADRKQISVSIGIGTYYEDPLMLHYSFAEAKNSMIDRFFQGNRLIFQYEKKNVRDHWKDPLSQEEKAELLARVRIGDEEGTVAYLKILLERMAQAYKHNVDMFKSEVIDLVMMMSRLVLEYGVSAATILSENARFIQDLYHTVRYDTFVKKVCEYGRQLTEQVASTHMFAVSPVIRQAIRYIKENHQKRISLHEIAQYCCLSKYHFSHLFKKETGMSFLDFLNKTRIEKAIHFLETTDLTIQQVAYRVGFEDANYFSRMFKKYTRYSPTAYRSARLC